MNPGSRIPTDPRHRFSWYARLVFANQRRRYGCELEPARLWARTPKVFAALSLLYGALDRRRSPIEPALRSLVTVRVSQINWCAFCVDINSATCLKRGVSDAQLAELAGFEQSAHFDARQKAALAYAEAMTRTDAGVDDALMARLRSHFNDDAIIELTALVAFQNMSSKFNAALAVAPQGFCRTGEGRPGAAESKLRVDSTVAGGGSSDR
ncbi:carboxymuconolactone decarboxylase family protein [Aromatoleum toluclasticum]|uniref:carboxymuconolactone decarboxylase family protein n=1 Tax=Aromatoleum toluclasticum TaxID=92003 RepID=UPI0003713D47|nr:carboxymuconolactone decarboxylase family protein [Aromatoleum toluclasticum]MCC4116270.1 carboxymuconolactone decarboxylase family protein [Aromatoleum toluclasticum]